MTSASRQPLVHLAVAAATGILIDSILGPSPWFWFLFFTVLAFLTIAGPRPTRSIAALLLLLPPAALRHSLQTLEFDAASIWRYVPEEETPVVMEGVIDRPPRLRPHPLAAQRREQEQSPWQTQWEMSLRRLRSGSKFRQVQGRALVTVDDDCDHLLPGDSVRVFGSMMGFQGPTNPGETDLRDVYRRRGLQVRINVDRSEQVVVLKSNRVHPGRGVAIVARSARRTLLGQLGPTAGPLAVALVIGQRNFVPPQTRDRLLTTGTAHLLSVSGLHLAIIVLLARLVGLLLRLPKYPLFIWVVAVSLLYVAITGGRPPVVRAAILVGVVALSFVMRRPPQTLNTLGLAALVLLFANAEYLFSIGVQLSFLAVATLLLGAARGSSAIERTLQHQRNLDLLVDRSRSTFQRYGRWLAQAAGKAFWYSGCVTVVALPLVWYQFHIVSPISVITNVLIGPIMFAALASGVVTVAMGWMAQPLTFLPAAVCGACLRLIDRTITLASNVPAGHFWLPSPPSWVIGLYYVCLLVALLWPQSSSRTSSPRQSVQRFAVRYGWIVCWFTFAWWSATTPAPLAPGTLEATFVDVGHGTSVVLRSGGEVWLYDCGWLGNESGSSRDIETTLWSLGTTRLDRVFLSHADADHFNALPGLSRRFNIGEIVTPPGMLDEPERALRPIRAAIGETGVRVREVARGAVLDGFDRAAAVLHPPRRRAAGEDNANSLVLRIDRGGTCLLLPGDLEPPGTDMLIRHPRLPTGSTMMAPHHGSLSVDTRPMLAWARPRETVVSGGDRARSPAVRQALAVTGSGVHVTSESGAVRVRISSAGETEISRWSVEPW